MNPSFFTSVINSYLPEPHASLLNGILFGISLKTTKEFYNQLKVVGLLHLVVLSGSNITLLSAVVCNLTKKLSKHISLLLTILTIIFFIIFVGPQAPVVRAGFMGILTFVAIIYGRKNIVLYSLFLSSIFIAIIWPQWLNSLSFKLSYGATLGIVLFAKNDPRKSESMVKELIRQITNNLRLSFAAQIFTVPIIFISFRQISLISPFTNLLVAGLIAPLMVFGFLTAILGKIHFFLGFLPASVCYVILSYLVIIVNLLSKLPFAFFQF